MDHDHHDLERKISNLERKLDDLDYELRRAKQEIEADIRSKADKGHSHPTE